MSKVFTYLMPDGSEKTIFIEKKIGEGGYGVVYKGILDGYGYIAVKEQKISKSIVQSILTEAEIRLVIGASPDYAIPLQRILIHPETKSQFPDIDLILKSNSVPKDKIITLYEYGGDVDLFSVVELHGKNSKLIDISILIQYIKELLQGLMQLHEKNICHRDIKPENIMLDRGKLKFIDFGLSCFVEKCKGKGGTPYYLAPEVYMYETEVEDYKKLDIFALGNTIYFMTTLGRNVIEITQDKNESIKDAIQSAILKSSVDEVRQHIIENVSTYLTDKYEIFRELILAMTEPNPKYRPNAKKLFQYVLENMK